MSQQDFNKLTKQRDNEMKQMLSRMNDLSDDCIKQKKHAEQLRNILLSEQNQFFILHSILSGINNINGSNDYDNGSGGNGNGSGKVE